MLKKICNRESIKQWSILYCALNLIFAYYQFTFFWGNHDWDWVKGTTQVLSLNTGMFEGRYSKFILNVFLFSGQVLPILNTMIAFALLALGAILLVNYWQIKEISSRFMIAFLPILSPYILGWLYFPINILGNFSAVACVAGGLLLAEQKGFISKLGAIICFITALGVYPSVAEMIIICYCFRYILNAPQKLKEMLPSGTIIIVSLIIFKLILTILSKYGQIVGDYYNLKTVSIFEFYHKTPEMLRLSGMQLIKTLPFLTLRTRILGLLIVILAIVFCYQRYISLIFWLIAWQTTVLSSWLTEVISETAYMPRVSFYGLNFFYTGALAVLLVQKNKGIKNIGLLLGILFLWNNITADIEAEKVWQMGKVAEQKLIDRINERVIDSASVHRRTAVIAGELSLRPRYYYETYQQSSPYILNQPLIVRHIPSGMMNFYEHTPLFYGNSQIYELTDDIYQFLQNAQTPWPAQKSLYLDNNYVIILLTKQGIAAIKAQMPH